MNKNSIYRSILIGSLGFTLLTGTAFGQSLVPTTVEPGRVQTDIRRELAPATISTAAEISTAPDVEAPKGAEKVSLVLKRVIIEGASKLPLDRLEAAYRDKISTTISLADVYGIANDITRIYRDNGFMLSRAVVPKQQIRDGVVHIQVIEGYISSYRIEGENFGARKELEAYAEKLVQSGTLNAENLERYLLLMNDLPGINVRSILVPSKTAFGGADLTLIVNQSKFNGFAGVDNFGNRFLGPLRVTLAGQANSLFRTSDQINGTVLWAPHSDELKFYSLGYLQNIGSEGTRAGTNITYSETNPTLPNSLGGLLDPEGESYLVSFNVSHPFIRSRALNLTGGLSFDFTENKTDFDDPVLSPIETEDSQRIARVSGLATYLDSLAGYNVLSATLSKGFEALGASEKGDTNLSRVQGDPGFTKAAMDVSRLQRLYGPFTGLLAVSGQYSADPLLASEEYGFGGSLFGRGYDFSEITGDHGLAGKAEIAYTGSVEKPYLSGYQLFTFYDLGKVWNRDPGAGQPSHESAASAGIGTRLTFTSTLQGEAFIAKPLTRDVTSRNDDGDDWRFKFSITSNF